MNKKVVFEFYEWDIIYILNCICLTKRILKTGRKELFEDFFKKEYFNEYMYDLTLMQKLIGYKSNRKLYDFRDYDHFLGQRDFLSGDGTFEMLFGKKRLERIKEIQKEESIRKSIRFSPGFVKNKYFKNLWFFKKSA